MRKLRLLLTLLATICMIIFGAYALASPQGSTSDDLTISTKSGLNIKCGWNHGKDCLSHVAGSGLYKLQLKETQTGGKPQIERLMVKDSTGAVLYWKLFNGGDQPTVEVRFKN